MSLPWLTRPVKLHSNRDAMCMMTPEQCAYKSRYWVFWYEADHRYALPTVAFFLSCIILFSALYVFFTVTPDRWSTSGPWRRFVSMARWASYRHWRIWGWNSQSLGAYLLGGVGVIFFACMTLGPKPYYWPNTRQVNFGDSPPIATRAGWMALACLPFLLVLATKANPIASLIGTSHEKLILWHIWIAWAMLVLALIHTFPFIVYNIWEGDIVTQWNSGGVWVTGVIALLAQAWLTFMSIRWLRERYYEFFKATHFLAAAVFVVFLFIHCDFRLTSWDYFIAAGVLYSLPWLYSQCRTYMEHGLNHRAHITLETGKMLKITIATTAEWTPGQHIYLRFLTQGVHALTAHPFTICSLPETKRYAGRNQMVFYVKPRGGLTARLARLADKNPGVAIPVLLDGPYGGVQRRWFAGFDHTVVVGGGAGAGFTLALAHDFLIQSRPRRGRDGGARMTLVVSSRDPGVRRWYLEALEQMVANWEKDETEIYKSSGLSVRIHETGGCEPGMETSDREDSTRSDKAVAVPEQTGDASQVDLKTFEMGVFQGRPHLDALCQDAVAAESASVGLVVCGPASMVYDVGKIAAAAQGNCIRGGPGAAEVWFHKESFS